jgi:hypothetical protein
MAFLEPDLLPQRMGDDQNIGEQDRRIERETSDRLQRNLDRKLGREAKVEESPHGPSDFSVFRKVSPGLPHQPDRRCRRRSTGKRVKKGLLVVARM